MTRIRLLICNSCEGQRDMVAERRAVETALKRIGLADSVQIADHTCFSTCAEPTSVALQSVGGASYVFSGINVVSDAADIAATCQTYLNSPAGWIEDARPCGRLRLCLRARIPAI